VTMTRPPGATRTSSGSGAGRSRPPGRLRIAGLRVRLTFGAQLLSMLVVLASAVILPAAAPGWPALAYLAATAALVTGVLASLVCHELAHALVARRYGAPGEQITVGFFGGLSHGRHEYATPRGMWRAAVAGPAASLVLAAASTGVMVGLAALGAGRLPVLVFAAFAWINAILAVMSLLPGAGLDGGRILHALAWARSGDRAHGAVVAARAGQVTGALLVIGGVTALALGYLDGLWAVLLGLAMVTASRAQAREVLAIAALADLRVRDALGQSGPPAAATPGWQTVQSFLDGGPAGPGSRTAGSPAGPGPGASGAVAFPLRDFDGHPAGLVTLSQLALVPPDLRDTLRLTDVATRPGDVVTATLDEPLGQLLPRLAIRPATPAAVHTTGHALVLGDDGAPVGVLTPADFSRSSQLGALKKGRRAP
jgi:Zn-dependent protease